MAAASLFWNQPRPQGFSLKKWVEPPIFEGEALEIRLFWYTNMAAVTSSGNAL